MIHLMINKTGWTLAELERPSILRDGELNTIYECKGGRWAIGPIEVALILRRLGVLVTTSIEPEEEA